jgi:ABC-type phosphate transport system substrate-binding protein
MKLRTINLYVVLITLAFVISASAQSAYVLIVNSDNEIESLSKKEVSDIFLKKNTHWQDKSKIKPADREKSAPVRENFSKDIHKKSVNAVIGYWQRKIFSGRGVPPVEKSSNKAVIEYVKSNATAIGYVSKDVSLPKGVKKIKVK